MTVLKVKTLIKSNNNKHHNKHIIYKLFFKWIQIKNTAAISFTSLFQPFKKYVPMPQEKSKHFSVQPVSLAFHGREEKTVGSCSARREP